MAGDGEIPGVVRGDLKKDAAVGPALAGLPGRMEEVRPELKTGRDAALANAVASALSDYAVLVTSLPLSAPRVWEMIHHKGLSDNT